MLPSFLAMTAVLAVANTSAAFASTPVPSPAPTATAKPAQTIHIENFMFVPMKLTIHAGQTVAFVNGDDEAHTVTATDGSFDSEGLDSLQTWTHAFAKAGTFAYFCELHPYMKATIVVLAGPAR